MLPINVKDYMKGLQGRITKFLDGLIAESKEHEKLGTNPNGVSQQQQQQHGLRRSISITSQSIRRSKK